MNSPFYHNVEDYHNTLNPIRDYLEQTSLYIQSLKGCSFEEAVEVAKSIVKKNYKDRQIKFFMRKDNGDRTVMQTSVLDYIATHVKSGHIISPSFTTYLPSSVKPSMDSDYTLRNVNERAQLKKDAQAEEAKGNTVLADSLDRGQNNKKIQNNAISGLYAAKTSILANPSAHTTLTSLTRTITSLSNANNERFVEDNRVFLTPIDVLNSVVNEARYTDQEAVRKAIDKFNIHVPTVDEVISVLRRSSDLYWNDTVYYDRFIRPFLEDISEEQRCGIVYSLSLYNIVKFNDEVMREFFRRFSHRCTNHTEKMEDPSIIYSISETVLYYAHSIHNEDIKGLGKDYELMNEKGVANNLYHTALNINETIEHYRELFEAFIRVDMAPINSNKLEYARRRAVVLSDTDSSAFSTDALVKWYFKDFEVTPDTIGFSTGITMLVSESIVHQLSRFSKTSNFELKNLRRLAMKNEYFWSAHVPAFTSKHYYARTRIKEGNVFPKPGLEIKGVHLRNSAVSEEIIHRGNLLMVKILDSVEKGKSISLIDILREAVDIENSVIEATVAGSPTYLRRLNVNDAAAYNDTPERSNYRHHTFWVDVFQDKYGDFGQPPYTCLQLPTVLTSKTAMDEWVNSIQDESIKSKVEAWMKKTGRKELPNIYINQAAIEVIGIPEELKGVISSLSVVAGVATQLRTVLETLGVVLNPKLTIGQQFNI